MNKFEELAQEVDSFAAEHRQSIEASETMQTSLDATEKECLEISEHIGALQDTAALIVGLQGKMDTKERITSLELLVSIRRMIKDLQKGE